jgi:ribosomal protein S19E (S16A)
MAELATGFDAKAMLQLDQLRRAGLVEPVGDGWRITEKGRKYLAAVDGKPSVKREENGNG